MLHRGVIAALALIASLALVAAAEPDEPLQAVFTCYRDAHHRTLLGRADVGELCEGAKDASPVDCYVEARARTFLSIEDAISLCRCATSTAPVACFREGHQTPSLDPAEVERLCSPSLRLGLGPECSPEQ